MEKFNEEAMKELRGMVIVDVAVEYLEKRRELEHLKSWTILNNLKRNMRNTSDPKMPGRSLT